MMHKTFFQKAQLETTITTAATTSTTSTSTTTPTTTIPPTDRHRHFLSLMLNKQPSL